MPIENLSRQQTRTRLALMNATIQLILEGGYDNLTVKAITDRADYGRRVFYVYFEDKDDIIYHIITNWLEKTTDNIFSKVNEYASPQREYRAFKLLTEEYLKNINFFRQVGSGFNGELRAHITRFAENDVKKHLALGNLVLQQGLSDEFVSQLHIGTMLNFLRNVSENADTVSADEMATMLFRFIFNQEPPDIDN